MKNLEIIFYWQDICELFSATFMSVRLFGNINVANIRKHSTDFHKGHKIMKDKTSHRLFHKQTAVMIQ